MDKQSELYIIEIHFILLASRNRKVFNHYFNKVIIHSPFLISLLKYIKNHDMYVYVCVHVSIYTVEPRYNEPLYNEFLGITNDIFRPSNSKGWKKMWKRTSR